MVYSVKQTTPSKLSTAPYETGPLQTWRGIYGTFLRILHVQRNEHFNFVL